MLIPSSTKERLLDRLCELIVFWTMILFAVAFIVTVLSGLAVFVVGILHGFHLLNIVFGISVIVTIVLLIFIAWMGNGESKNAGAGIFRRAREGNPS